MKKYIWLLICEMIFVILVMLFQQFGYAWHPITWFCISQAFLMCYLTLRELWKKEEVK